MLTMVDSSGTGVSAVKCNNRLASVGCCCFKIRQSGRHLSSSPSAPSPIASNRRFFLITAHRFWIWAFWEK